MFNELDLQSLWKELDEYDLEIDRESRSLQDVCVKIAELRDQNEIESKELQDRIEFQFLDPQTLINLNIGGQLFEITVDILTRDPFSILAACCRTNPLFQKSEDSKTIYFDRDWWIFRHILSYLRSSILPNEIETLKELYKEASFYRLESLQRSIEEIPVSEISNINAELLQSSTRNFGSNNHGNINQPSYRPK